MWPCQVGNISSYKKEFNAKFEKTTSICSHSLPISSPSLAFSKYTSFIALSPMENNHTHNHNHNQLVNKLHQHPHHHHHHVPFPSTSVLLIVIPIIIIILLVSILVLIIMLRRLHHSKENVVRTSTKVRNSITNKNCLFIPHSTININSSPENDGGCLYSSTTTGSSTQTSQSKLKGVQVFTYKEVEMATEGFSEANVIGIGGYGVVYRGILSDGTVAAIKMLRRQGKQGERAFRLEVDLLSRLQSPYLVELLGYCADQHHRLLIFEFMPNGPLQHHLHPTNKKQAKPLSWGTRLGIALDCARALEYLHEYTTPSVIHRDFKCTNVLLDENYQAKVSDFELAKIGSDKLNGLISTRVLGTTGYLAPEYASTGKLTTKSDVYSYGVVLLELLTGRVPIDTQRPPGEHVLVSWALPRLTNRDKLVEMVDPAIQGQYSKKDLIQVAAIAAMCIQTEADYRPLMTDVVQSLVPLAKNYSSGNASISSSFRCTPRVSPRSIN